MNIFISHSSKNSKYGQAIVDLLVSIGVSSDQIIFTSNDAFGIPSGQNIFNWLKTKITEKPHVIYLLSPEYYKSIACLNEMGAAWIVENEHTIIFTPGFSPSSSEFQSGALDPREIGFMINNHDRITGFVESLRLNFPISKQAVFVSQKIREFVKEIDLISSSNPVSKESSPNESRKVLNAGNQSSITLNLNSNQIENLSNSSFSHLDKFLRDLQEGRLKNEEILILRYAIDTARFNLGVGWKTTGEIENIKTWEDVNSLNSTLSNKYDDLMRRLGFKKLTEVSELTSSNNPREVVFIHPLIDVLLDPPPFLIEQIDKVLSENIRSLPVWDTPEQEDLPF
ncbi:toll/interleukin-1 receptor domain-containing protein [Sphingobacterium athyrii]|uniref:TIR domain-containing protein n=1 Tax=Sphingobacterium athyrii TaxID=2152717 RepID=A0A363NV50_9SPHI|nr:toll/interleukin-1 receptor domain-containing protein [Sphingobacterium athyrii]PUV24531.1 hypothetical protein DCO56_14410 [Sphingobacterium athyrii]